MSLVTASRVDLVLGAFGLGLVGVVIWTVVLACRGSWVRARVLAAATFWLSVVVQLLACFVVPFAVVSSLLVPAATDGEPSAKASVLAESISDGMNCVAPVALATLAAIVVWAASVWQARKARRAGAPADR